MASKDDNFEQMFDLWKEGQEAFFKAQNDIAKTFAQSFTDGMAPQTPSGAETFANWQAMVKAWAPTWDANSFDLSQQATAFTSGNDAWLAMLDPANWTKQVPEQLRNILESISRAPQFADLATPHAEAAAAWRETLDYQNAAAELGKTMQEAWTRAFQRYSESHTLDDLQTGDVQAALDAWLKAANAELLETQRSPSFMQAQRKLLRASMEIKARQREIAEAWCDAYQIPTRTEVDDLTKIVHELRRELRKAKREIAALRSASGGTGEND
ncbi:MAG: poly(R)-hydroxyalkanoic acid synthase subunit PhaE [Pseudomonadota bacterium]